MATRLIAAILSISFVMGCTRSTQPTSVEVAIAGETFTLELSTDTPSRIHGLMERTSIPDHGGMLFVFTDASERSFWMANCLINIDLLFLDSRGTITAAHEMKIEEPQGVTESQWDYERRLKHYYSNGPARFAIELQEGTIQRLHLRVNDRIPLDLRDLRNIAR
ncbi:MAG: DUF192 domain-containing protein [Phycisphaerae bacterium]|jgi:uncharacterized protein|nr:DUF192 domain-containing protein [Phycisphaerae bacterium]HJN71240.1 DUF192 domain-containing protein [Phycisphaerales bacterium]|tara:strand:- start:14 stop:505 length:492 start_codon:yes stop_codon:yes gene_type:complete